jgi:hypothetical protein
MSIDGGSVWRNKLRMQGASDGYPTPVTKSVDLQGLFGEDLSDVRVRFHYYQGSYEWWWAIDNVKVRCEMLACTPCGTTAPPPGEAGTSTPLTVRRVFGSLVFEWGAPDSGCLADDYAVYRGDLSALATTGYSHDQILSCGTGGTSLTVSLLHPAIGVADYYLVVSANGSREGSYGTDSESEERPVSAAACQPAQDLAACSP